MTTSIILDRNDDEQHIQAVTETVNWIGIQSTTLFVLE